MNKLLGFDLLFVVLVLVLISVYSVTVKNASAIYFGNGPCPSGETRDYMGICFPVNECKASLFAAHGTCKGTSEAPKPKCTTVNGEQQCTISAPKYTGSPIPGKNIVNATKNFLTSVPSCKKGPPLAYLVNASSCSPLASLLGHKLSNGKCEDLMEIPITTITSWQLALLLTAA
jgi:hypothetical protein